MLWFEYTDRQNVAAAVVDPDRLYSESKLQLPAMFRRKRASRHN